MKPLLIFRQVIAVFDSIEEFHNFVGFHTNDVFLVDFGRFYLFRDIFPDTIRLVKVTEKGPESYEFSFLCGSAVGVFLAVFCIQGKVIQIFLKIRSRKLIQRIQINVFRRFAPESRVILDQKLEEQLNVVSVGRSGSRLRGFGNTAKIFLHITG